MEVNGKIYYPDLMDNSSAEAFFKKLKEGKLVVDLHDYGSFEKVGALPWNLPRNDEKITTVPGDIILYQGNQITIYYDENTWEFTRLAKIHDVSKDELLDVFGEGDVTVSFWLEWSE
ncbi:MAG: cyclophilin-like fold protein [Eubacteriales bacterium]|nr:cyclophilin-like fold protein [Eubacteriales bacterium]